MERESRRGHGPFHTANEEITGGLRARRGLRADANMPPAEELREGKDKELVERTQTEKKPFSLRDRSDSKRRLCAEAR